MTKSEAHEHLQLCTVKIESDYDVGSGFFIEKGLIVTCYHVIEDCLAKQLTIIWQGESYKASKIESNPDDDLAIITLKIDEKHPHVQLDKTINPDDRCSFYGFPENHREEGMIRNCEHEGTTKKLLAFREGQFEHGFSGSAILNFETGKVCGVVNKTRDAYSDLGGYAIPLPKLISFLESKGYEVDDNGSIFAKEMFKNWVWTSSVESADRLQFSILALVETLVVVNISLFFWIYLKLYWHIITGLIVTPFYLLKNKKSENDAIILFFKFLNFFSIFNKKNNYKKILFKIMIFLLKILIIIYFYLIFYSLYLYLGTPSYGFILFGHPIIVIEYLMRDIEIIPVFFLILFFLSLFINKVIILSLLSRMYITIKNLFKIKRIPKNFFKIVFNVDITSPLEILPSIEKKTIRNKNLLKEYLYSISYIYSKQFINDEITAHKNSKFQNFFIIILNIFQYIFLSLIRLFSIITMIIPILFIRYMMKSTAWIYLPLIWLIDPLNQSGLNARMRHHSKHFMAYIMFLYSWIILVLFTFMPLVYPDFIKLYTTNLPTELETIFFAYPQNFNHWFGIWYITRFLSAFITILYMIGFTHILSKRELDPNYGSSLSAKLLSMKWIRD